MAGPPEALVRSLTSGSGGLAGFEWHDEVGSTNDLASRAAQRGAPEIHLVLADVQTAGRGRRGRTWHAPPGTSLTGTFLLRPAVAEARLGTLPLLAGVVLAEVADGHLAPARAAAAGARSDASSGDGPTATPPGPVVALKWPNDLLVRPDPGAPWAKAGGILVERVAGAALVGIGCNVDWRTVARPPEAIHATSLAEAAGAPVDRWRLLAGLVGVLARRYRDWQDDPDAVLNAYRERCATIGRTVRLTRGAGPSVEGHAVGIAEDGRLELATEHGPRRVSAGDVEHVRDGEA